MPSLELEGRRIEIEPGDTIASALFRAGVRIFSRSFKYHRPRGLYCLTGDCPNCLLTVDGEPAVRACTTPARDGQRIVRENGWPSVEHDALSVLWRLRRLLPVGFYYKTFLRPRRTWSLAEPLVRRLAGIGTAPGGRAEPGEARHHHCDLLVAGGGPAGVAAALAAGRAGARVVLAEEGFLSGRLDGGLPVTVLEHASVVGVYEGPLVPVVTDGRLHLVHPARVVVATGAVELHPVFPGSDLPGVWLGRAAVRLARDHGLAAGHTIVYEGSTDESLDHVDALLQSGASVVACLPEAVAARTPARVRAIPGGEVVSAVGRRGVRAAVIESPSGNLRIPCDAIAISRGLVPRDGLLRQAAGLPVGVTGDAAREPTRRPAPRDGVVCLCEDVLVADLQLAWDEGFRSTELLKRYTTVTMGPCQGALCQSHLTAFVRERCGDAVAAAPTTARPPARPLRLADAAAGIHYTVEPRTARHDRHVALGACMEWAGAWKRPEHYGDPSAEYRAVREAVGVMDVGTLGKFLLAGPDVAAFLERLYPCRIGDLEPGRLRYALLLNEAGYVLDDGVVCALAAGRWYLTFTSGGAERAEAWLRDWADAWGHEIYLVNRTAAIGAINVVGPASRELLARLGADLSRESPPYLGHTEASVAGVHCLALRLGFTGELGYELHHDSTRGVELWDALLAAGAVPHGLEALRLLRLEKGHVIVGQDTDFDSTPAKLGLDFAVAADKPDFIGKRALERIDGMPARQRLAKLVFPQAAPPEGAPLSAAGRHAGHVTSSRFSPSLGQGVALGWLRADGDGFPTEVEAAGLAGRVVARPPYDPEGERLRA
jgi:sarcosine oxidase subunit alpha